MHLARLRHIVESTPWLMEVLEVVRDVGPSGAYVAAGAIRDTVWGFLTRRPLKTPWADVDVVHFDKSEPAELSSYHETQLGLRAPSVRWEVTNQAWVHAWHELAEGQRHRPHTSVLEGLATWPETATAVGVRLEASAEISVMAPFGLDDLFNLVVRHNPARASAAVYRRRVVTKQWASRWPELRILTPEAG